MSALIAWLSALTCVLLYLSGGMCFVCLLVSWSCAEREGMAGVEGAGATRHDFLAVHLVMPLHD